MPLPAFTLTSQLHAELKRALYLAYPDVSASNRAEALARGLGFNSNAALHASLPGSPSVRPCPGAFSDFVSPRTERFDVMGFGNHLARPIFDSIGDAPRWVLVEYADDDGPGSLWPHFGPHVCVKGMGMAKAIMPDGFIDRGCGRVEAFRSFAGADQSSFDLRPHSGPDKPWNRMFWPGDKDSSVYGAHEDGTPVRSVYAGMGHWIIDLGAYDGGRAWPGSPSD